MKPMLIANETFMKEVWEEINFIRTRPQEFADILEREELPKYHGLMYTDKDSATYIYTHEGATAVNECIEACRKMKPSPALEFPNYYGMNQSSQDCCDDLTQSGATENCNMLGSELSHRLRKYGFCIGACSENIAFQTSAWFSGRQTVRALAIDDGVSSRKHFYNMINPEFKIMGVGLGPHRVYGAVCVINFAVNFKENSTSRENSSHSLSSVSSLSSRSLRTFSENPAEDCNSDSNILTDCMTVATLSIQIESMSKEIESLKQELRMSTSPRRSKSIILRPAPMRNRNIEYPKIDTTKINE